jgi:hypothetical protein
VIRTRDEGLEVIVMEYIRRPKEWVYIVYVHKRHCSEFGIKSGLYDILDEREWIWECLYIKSQLQV